MVYLLDTVTVVRHFCGTGNIGRHASRILAGAETGSDLFAISAVSLMEILYLAERNRIQLDVAETVRLVLNSRSYLMVDLNHHVVSVAATIDFPELHDRLILATAKWMGISVLSSDRAFRDVEGIDVIWD